MFDGITGGPDSKFECSVNVMICGVYVGNMKFQKNWLILVYREENKKRWKNTYTSELLNGRAK